MAFRRALGRPLVREWKPEFEVGMLFWRAQFNHALAMDDFVEGRRYFDSLRWRIGPTPRTDIRATSGDEPRGHWFIPHNRTSDATMLYFHGGGYAVYAAATHDFIAMLADTLGLAIYAPDYRLTPEHAHPAQIDDALTAYRFLLDQGHEPSRLVIGGTQPAGI